MNRIYRLVWSARLAKLVVVHEKARSHGRGASGSRTRLASALLGALMTGLPLGSAWAAPPGANTLPNGYTVSAGSATISSQGTAMTVQQTSARTAIDWQSFSVGSNARVNFQQPNASAVVLNRVVGNEASVIDGALQANGQVFLLNSNGLLFTRNAQVNVGGLVASTLDTSNADFMAGKSTFNRTGSAASVVNQGSLNASEGGYIALLGQQVSNQGTISARLGTAAMAAGDQISLSFNDRSLVGVRIDQGALQALVDNQSAIMADGGLVLLTAQGMDQVMASAVNNSGEVRARTLGQKEGRIYLLGDMQSGTTHVAGTLDASAPEGGNGGLIETSAAHIQVADSARITTAAPHGLTGSWLVDPQDLTIAASGGDLSGSTVSSNLANTNVTLVSSQGATAGSGNININDPISWSANTLTLTAANHIKVNAVMTATGHASLNLNPGTANGSDGAVTDGTVLMGLSAAGTTNAATGNSFSGQINFSGAGQLTINGTLYTVINSLGAAGSTTGTDLQGMNGNLAGHYVLGSNIDASATATWNACSTCNNGGAGHYGFTPIGAYTSASPLFTGIFDGLGHSISHLQINTVGLNQQRGWQAPAGLFGAVSSTTPTFGLRNVGIVDGTIQSGASAGALAGGGNSVSVANSYATGNVIGAGDVGGLIGDFVDSNGPQPSVVGSFFTGSVTTSTINAGGLIGFGKNVLIDNSYTDASVAAPGQGVGGLAGYLTGPNNVIRNSHTTGPVSGLGSVGGLVGASMTNALTISDSYATGNITSTGSNVGGLVGYGYGVAIRNSYATGNVTGGASFADTNIGGLVGFFYGSINNSYATGQVSGGRNVGGLAGHNYSGLNTLISESHATGSVTGTSEVGGLVGFGEAGLTVGRSYASGNVSATSMNAGGLVGKNIGVINDSHASGSVSSPTLAGGLVGYNTYAGSTLGQINRSFATGDVSVSGTTAGGLVGMNYSGGISNSFATGAVSGTGYYGGLVGVNLGTLNNNAYTQPTLYGIGVDYMSASNPARVALSMLQTRAFISGTLGWDIAGDASLVVYPTLR